jgi:hypothetical protein
MEREWDGLYTEPTVIGREIAPSSHLDQVLRLHLGKANHETQKEKESKKNRKTEQERSIDCKQKNRHGTYHHITD